ncbi:carbohydrate ABC transporter permease [Actinopolymorpha pittospori]
MENDTQRTAGGTQQLATHGLLVLFGIVMIYPLLWMASSSLKPNNLIFTEPGLLSGAWTLRNYVDGWNQLGIPFGQFFMNSFTIAVISVLANLVSCSLAAYAFARMSFRFKRPMFALMLGTIMLPFHVVVVPQYILFHALGWVNTFYPLIVPKFLAVDAFFVFLMVQFIRGIPRELDDAAAVDGCGAFGIFWRIIFPLMRPALAVTAVFTFIWSWNDFFTPLLYLTDQQLYTAPVALNSFLDSTGESDWGGMFAMSILSLAPIFLVFVVAQRHLVQGIATTGLK